MEIVRGYEEANLPGAYESMSWPTAASFAERVAEKGGFEILRHEDLPDPPWTQAVLRKLSPREWAKRKRIAH